MRTETAVATGPPYLFKKAHPTIHATQYTLYSTGASNIWQLWTTGLSTFTERRQVCVWPCAAVTLTRPQAVPAAPCLSRGRCSVLGGPPALRPEHRGLVIVGGGGGRQFARLGATRVLQVPIVPINRSTDNTIARALPGLEWEMIFRAPNGRQAQPGRSQASKTNAPVLFATYQVLFLLHYY